MPDYPPELVRLVRQRLLDDQRFNLKSGQPLRNGMCRECGKKKCFITPEKFFFVKCGSGIWGGSKPAGKLSPDFFLIFSRLYGGDNRDAVADGYMCFDRGFSSDIIKGMYQQGARHIRGKWYETVRVQLWDGHYWERLIDADAVDANEGRKAMFSNGSAGAIKGRAWIPPGMEICRDDRIIITEGIFKSMAWLHVKDETGKPYKSITGMSAGNIPVKTIKEHADKNILWVLALDNDTAGHENAEKFVQIMTDLKQRYLVAFPRRKGEDWDDLFRKGALGPKMYQESVWRGRVDMAKSRVEKAAWIFARERSGYFLFDFDCRLFSCKMNSDTSGFTNGLDGRFDIPLEIGAFREVVDDIDEIANTTPEFLYFERDSVTGAQEYFFRAPLRRYGRIENETIALDGSVLASPDTFSKTLMSLTSGRYFDGKKVDLAILKDRWFNYGTTYVRSLPFVGYDKSTGVYVFHDWACHNGRILAKNENDFFEAGKHSLKVKTPKGQERNEMNSYMKPGAFTPDWLTDYQGAFSWNGMVVLAWWLGTLFAEQIRAEFGYWPVMEVTGEQGTGKTQMIEFLWRCCGRSEYEGFDPSKSTLVGRSRTFQQVANLPVVLLEGDRESGKTWDYNEIKMLYNGRYGRAIGVKTSGNETIEGVFRGGVMIAQNATVATESDAVLARIVHVHCTKEHFTPEGEQMALRLNRMPTADLCGFIGAAVTNERRLLRSFRANFEKLDGEWLANHDIQNRIVHNHAMVAAWLHTLPELFGNRMRGDWLDYLTSYLWSRAQDRQARCAADHPLLAQFWEQYEFIQTAQLEAGSTKNQLNHSKTPGEIAINLQHFQNLALNYRLEMLPLNELKRLFPIGKRYRLIANKPVNSAIRPGQSVRCYVFSAKGDSE
ncbi:toprim domain-containing protein [Victivallis sp. Marseille-Q1083]|uniref:toprim domain-containing protein n=1 Tax=Victivallis sp. Marseille-Q1083 TaxID=2717288 RepID=UPI00158B3183|nr:toprim domain-containing protein [Victivallis sp. Marseille-Q1083]